LKLFCDRSKIHLYRFTSITQTGHLYTNISTQKFYLRSMEATFLA